MPDIDLIVRNGLVVDGLGGEPFEADVAVVNGRIAAIGKVQGRAREEIDARGKIVTPGFVDIHTHYDGQVTWDERLMPSSLHGVTSVVMGNCGVGFAPCRPEQRELLLQLMEGVEDIPQVVLAEGVPWKWESFPQYLDFVAGRRFDIDCAAYVPHAALRVFVMGQRAFDREPATADDRARMAAILTESIAAGAMGFGTSRTVLHRSSSGDTTPTVAATEAELTALATAVAQSGRGIMQFVSDWDDLDRVLPELRRIIDASNCPLTIATAQQHHAPTLYRDMLDWTAQANADGHPVKVQVLCRPFGLVLGHDLSLNPFYTTATYRKLAHLPLDQRVRELRRPEVKAAILDEPTDPNPTNLLGLRVRKFEWQFPFGDPPNYEPLPETSVAAQAQRRGMRPDELCYDLLLEKDGHNLIYQAGSNYAHGSLDTVREMLTDPHTVPALGDGGAHLGCVCDASYSTFMLAHWTRDRTRGARLPLSFAVKQLTADTADLVGLRDRGRLGVGYRADLNVIDIDRLTLGAPEIIRDLPAGGRRMIQRTKGYVATVVNGTVTYREGEATGALPGRLVRGQQDAPRR